MFPLILLFPVVAYASYSPSELPDLERYESGELGACTECHKQVYPINEKDFDNLSRKKVEVNHGKNEDTYIFYDKKNVVYLWIKDGEYLYLLPSKITDNPHKIK